jgi:hypothetical protein
VPHRTEHPTLANRAGREQHCFYRNPRHRACSGHLHGRGRARKIVFCLFTIIVGLGEQRTKKKIYFPKNKRPFLSKLTKIKNP